MARLALLFALAALLAASCAQPAPAVDVTKGEIRADMKEYAIALTSAEVRSGTVTFQVRNLGTVVHDFTVIKTDTAVDQLPVDRATQKASDAGKVDGIPEIAPGKSANLRLDLQPGRYVIICNVATHYQLGMRTELRVN